MNDKIFVWRGYGEINVYKIDNKEDVYEIFNSIEDIIINYNLEEELDKCRSKIYNEKFDLNQICNILNSFIHKNLESYDDDNFQLGTGFMNLKKFFI